MLGLQQLESPAEVLLEAYFKTSATEVVPILTIGCQEALNTGSTEFFSKALRLAFLQVKSYLES